MTPQTSELTGGAPKPKGWAVVTENGDRFDFHDHPLLRALRTGEVQADRIMGIQHPDGRLVWISMNTTPITRPGEQRPYAAITSFSDISARRAADAALRESEQRFSLLARQPPVGIFHTDVAGSCTFVNEHYCALTGIAARDALGDGWHQIIHPDDRQRVFAEWTAAAQGGRPFQSEYRLTSRAGEVMWVERNAGAIVDARGTVSGYIGSIHDLSQRKRAEESMPSSRSTIRSTTRPATTP